MACLFKCIFARNKWRRAGFLHFYQEQKQYLDGLSNQLFDLNKASFFMHFKDFTASEVQFYFGRVLGVCLVLASILKFDSKIVNNSQFEELFWNWATVKPTFCLEPKLLQFSHCCWNHNWKWQYFYYMTMSSKWHWLEADIKMTWLFSV